MSGGGGESAPGAGKLTGGAEDRHHHPDGASIPANGGPGDGEALSGDTAAAVDFLRRWCPGGPWVLTSIVPDGRTTTATFTGTEAGVASMRGWIDRRQGRENVYFTVNALYGEVESKPNKGAVAAVHALHVDVDPRVGEDFNSERERAERFLREFTPPPTVIIDSGGGFQGFWLLEGDVPVGGSAELARLVWRDAQPKERGPLTDPERAELDAHLARLWDAVEARNTKIEVALQGDSCHNADRIMRLPGTVNVPNAKKRKKGRVPRLARVVAADWTRLYRMEDFEPAPKLGSGAAGGATRAVTAAPAAGVDLEALPVSDLCRRVIVNGHDPDNPTRWEGALDALGRWVGDRSEAVWWVACEMARAGVGDAEALGVLLDPDHGISEHVREQKGSERYARRQVERARAEVESSAPGLILTGGEYDWATAFLAQNPNLIHHLGEFLDWDGAAYLAVTDSAMRSRAWSWLHGCRRKRGDEPPEPFTPNAKQVSGFIDALKGLTFRDLSPPCWLDGRVGPDPLEVMSTRSGLVHLPTGQVEPATPAFFTRNALDFAHDPAAPEPERWLRFLRDAWEEEDSVTALQDFMGYLLTPDMSLQKALMMVGPKRSGKGTIINVMRALVGEASTVDTSAKELAGQFGFEALLGKSLAVLDDMRIGPKTDEAALAELLLRATGGQRATVNRKNIKAVSAKLTARFVVTSNEVPKFAERTGALASRFVVIPMSVSFFGREDRRLGEKLAAELPGILLWAMEGWRRVQARGRLTEAAAGRELTEMMEGLGSPIHDFIATCCELGREFTVDKDHLFSAFRLWHEESQGQPYRSVKNIFARDLHGAGCKIHSHQLTGGGRVFRGVRLRDGVGADLFTRAAQKGEPPWPGGAA